VLSHALDSSFHTYDGTSYKYLGECDLVMARSPTFDKGLGFEVHARTQIIDEKSSLISNAVVRIGTDIFEVSNKGVHYLNGVQDVKLPTLMLGSYEISKSEIKIEGTDPVAIETKYTIALDQEDKIQIAKNVAMLSINVTSKLIDTSGMLGTCFQQGLVGRDGKLILGDNSNEMGTQWQVTDAELKLFNEIRAPQFPEQCILKV
jgi:von Willebrand factor type D domain